MKFFDYLKDRFFASPAEEGQLLQKEKLKRDAVFFESYNEWLQTEEHSSMVHLLVNNYKQQRKINGKVDEAFCFVLIPGVNGLTYVYNPQRWSANSFSFLQEYIKENLKDLGYKVMTQETETWQYSDRKEKVEKYQLIHSDNAKNKILLRVIYQNNKPKTLKWCANLPLTQGCSFKGFEKQIQQISRDSL